jgi:hypothetical protein
MKILVIPSWWKVGTKVRIVEKSYEEMVAAAVQFKADYGLQQWSFEASMLEFSGCISKIEKLSTPYHPSCRLELVPWWWSICWLEPVEAVPFQSAMARKSKCPLCGSPGDDLAFTFYCQKEGCRNFHP